MNHLEQEMAQELTDQKEINMELKEKLDVHTRVIEDQALQLREEKSKNQEQDNVIKVGEIKLSGEVFSVPKHQNPEVRLGICRNRTL